MAKKIKHYSSKSIYGRSSQKKKWGKIALWVIGAIVLFYAGFYILGGIFAKHDEPIATTSEPATSSDISTEDIPTSDIPPAISSDGIKADFADFATISSKDKLDKFLKQAKEAGYNAVSFELKDSTGQILYSSTLENVQKAKALVSAPVDLKMIVQTFKDNNMTPLPVIHSFKDPKASAKIPGSAIWYQNTEGYLWFDNYAEKGGKPWLNPYSSAAKQYICDIQNEILSAGFKTIIIDSLKFGSKVGNSVAGFGKEATGSRIDALTTFVKQSEAVAKKLDSTVIFAIDADDIIKTSTDYLDGNILALNPQNIAPIFSISKMPAKISIGATTYDKPTDVPKEITDAIIAQIKTTLPQSKILPIFTDYDSIKQSQKQGNSGLEFIDK